MSVALPATPEASTSEESPTDTALAFLRHHRDFMERERRARLYFVRLAREHGLSFQVIGDALGMTEAGVRKLLDRAEPPRGAGA